MGAAEAHAAGLVTSIVPAADVVDAALELGDRIAAMPPLAVRAAKRSVLAAAELPLSAGLRAEREAFFDLFATDDQREGMRAFQEKRPPTWTGEMTGAQASREDRRRWSVTRTRAERTWGATSSATSPTSHHRPSATPRRTSSRPSTRPRRSAATSRRRSRRVRPIDAPEHDWGLARARSCDPRSGRSGRPASRSRRSIATRSRSTRCRATPSRCSTWARPGIPVVYTLPAGGFDIVVNGDHLLSWGIEPSELQDAAMANLASVGCERPVDRRA